MKTNKNLLKGISKVIELEDNSCLVDLYGEHDENEISMYDYDKTDNI